MGVREYVCKGVEEISRGYTYDDIEAEYQEAAESEAAKNFQEDKGISTPLWCLKRLFKCKVKHPKTPGRKPTYLGEEIEKLMPHGRRKEVAK